MSYRNLSFTYVTPLVDESSRPRETLLTPCATLGVDPLHPVLKHVELQQDKEEMRPLTDVLDEEGMRPPPPTCEEEMTNETANGKTSCEFHRL